MDYKYPPPPLNMNLTLEVYVFPEHLPYMQLLFTPGPGNRSVKIHNPLDVEVIEVTRRLNVNHRCNFSNRSKNRSVLCLPPQKGGWCS